MEKPKYVEIITVTDSYPDFIKRAKATSSPSNLRAAKALGHNAKYSSILSRDKHLIFAFTNTFFWDHIWYPSGSYNKHPKNLQIATGYESATENGAIPVSQVLEQRESLPDPLKHSYVFVFHVSQILSPTVISRTVSLTRTQWIL